jgi:hypothetical protein
MKSDDFYRFEAINWKIPLFFRFLQVSPTYRMAYEHVYQQAALPDCHDYVRLLKSAERFGDVWGLSFKEWWFQHGQYWLDFINHIQPKVAARYYGLSLPSAQEMDEHHFRTLGSFDEQLQCYKEDEFMPNGSPDTVMLAIPVNGDADMIEKHTIELLQAELNKLPESIRRRSRIKFQKNKIRNLTLEKYLYAIYTRALYFDDLKLHQLGAKIDKEYPQTIRKDESDSDEPPERIIGIKTSELLRKALFVSEWAALSEFPVILKHDRIKNEKAKMVLDEVTGKRRLQLIDEQYNLSFNWRFIKEQISAGKIDPEL